jgi:hypothetical protein
VGPRRFGKQAAPLIIAHRFDAHSGRSRKRSDRVRIFCLIPYHGTDAIRRGPGVINTPDKRELNHGKDDRDEECRRYQQLRQGGLPLQSVHLQELQLLV